VKIDLPDEYVPLLIRALEHFNAYLQATSRHDSRYQEIADLIKRKGPGKEEGTDEKREKRRG
jgi:hypothetical protein